MNFNKLSIKQVISRIGDQAKTVIFEIPTELKEQYQWQAGQHITLSFDVDSENGTQEVRRNYTISASPHTKDGLQITTKRVKGGLISNHINDNLKVGDSVLIAPPNGSFILEPMASQQRTHYFFGAGSGITPLWAMINTVLLEEPHSTCHLLYANHNDTTTIFKDELKQLQAQFPKRLTVSHVFSQPKKSWLGNDFNYWKKGRIDQDVIAEFIREHPPYAQDTQYYMCAPNVLLSVIQSGLQSIDVPSDRIHYETFGGDVTKFNDSIIGVQATLSVILSGQQHEVAVDSNETLLAAMRNAGVDAPFSCQSGVCGACKANISEGEVAMKARMALEDKDIAKGDILTCQALCQTERVSISI